MRRCILAVVVIAVVLLLAALVAASRFNLSAMPDPGRTETFFATEAKRFLISGSSQKGVPPEPPSTQASITEGDTLFGVDCSACHGMSGRTPTETGRWMYPRAADLGSAAVQQYSDRELFWIVENGIRLSGMPAFGKVETDEHIWDLVHYLRTLPASAKLR